MEALCDEQFERNNNLSAVVMTGDFNSDDERPRSIREREVLHIRWTTESNAQQQFAAPNWSSITAS